MLNPLARYLKKNNLTPGTFARTAGLDRATVYRIAKGQRGAGMFMARELERATGGAVKMSDWPVHSRAA